MAKYHLTHKARTDLSEIWDYTFDIWSEARADKYYSLLLDTCADLATRPDAGKKYEEINFYLLGYKIMSHIIFYRVLSGNEIVVVRILHNRMDLKSRLED